jgi:hypothetical protein
MLAGLRSATPSIIGPLAYARTTVAVLEKMSVEFDVVEFCWNLSTPSGVLEITQLRVETNVYFSARVASNVRYAFGSGVACDVVTPFLLPGVHTFYITLGAT